MKHTLLFLCTLSLWLSGCNANPELLTTPTDRQIQSLDGTDWTFNGTQNASLVKNPLPIHGPATVPGVIHTDLLRNGLIEDPFRSADEAKYQWIGDQSWTYELKFVPDTTITGRSAQEVVFDGLDTYADVYLNGEHILGRTDNMFVQWRVPVTGKLNAGAENTLQVVFHPAYPIGRELAKAWPVKLPADNDKGAWKTSVFTRKAPYHFGWDWGPRFLTMGLWRPVRLEAYNALRIETVQYVQKTEAVAGVKSVDIEAIVSLQGAANGPVTVTLTDENGKGYGKQVLQAGQEARVAFRLENPKLWWPRGMGQAALYGMNIVITDADGRVLDRDSQRIGIRTIKLVQKPDAQGPGVSFEFEVNGQPCFMKGANYIPQDNFLPRVDTARYRQQIGIAAASNMNMLRIWGGGFYENQIFYDLCDEQGIMVWQDFIFGCSFYPWNPEFLDNVRREAIYNVQRLRNHPSIAIWCGNNEIDEAWYHWGYQRVYGWTPEQATAIKHGIDTLFRGVLADVVATEDPGRPYHPSSPLYGRGNPKSQLMGDVHYWGVFHDEEPFSVYKDKPGRFSNEYGFQSLACYDTYREYFQPQELKLYSEAMVVHQKNPKGYRVIEEYMVRDLPLLKDDFRTYVYLTQLLQAEGIKIAMEGHRSKRPWTMGSLYWQLNDCWPVTSWSSHDSRYRWKALQFQARRSFAPTILSFERIDSSATAVLWAITDELTEQRGDIRLRLLSTTAEATTKAVWDTTLRVQLAPNSNLELLRRADVELLAGRAAADYFLVAEGQLNGAPVRALYHFTPLKGLQLSDKEGAYTVSYRQTGSRTVEATIRANTLMKAVLFEARALQLNPSDGYFDLLPGQEKSVTLEFVEPIGAEGVDGLGIFVTALNGLLGLPSEQPVTKNVE